MAKPEGACKHPPRKLFSWMVKTLAGSVLCVGCTVCGAILTGAADDPQK
jgi:hypothetical protein